MILLRANESRASRRKARKAHAAVDQTEAIASSLPVTKASSVAENAKHVTAL